MQAAAKKVWAKLWGHGMDELAVRHLGHTCIAFKDVCGTGKKAISFAEVPLDRATAYAAEDADVTWRLHRLLKPRLTDENAARIYERVDRPLIPVVAQMERHGIKVDREKLAGLSAEFAKETGRLEGEIHALAGEPFTIGSPKQLGDILFDKMGLKGGKKGKSGQYSTDVGILEGLAAQGVEMAGKVLEWRQLSKLRSTYTEALQAAINPQTGRVHTSYSLVGAQTGRLSSTEPNLQNIPIRTEIGRQIRDCFVAEPGNVILAADYSQIELRLAAHMADVPSLKEAFAAGEDIHARTAQEMFGTVDRDTRGPRQDDQLRHPLWHFALGPCHTPRDHPGRSAGGDRPLLLALPRHPELYPCDARIGARARLFRNPVRPQMLVPPDQVAAAGRTAGFRSAPRSMRRSRALRPTSSSGRWRG